MLIDSSGVKLENSRAVVAWKDWQEGRDKALANNEGLTLCFPNDENIYLLKDELARLDEIVLVFPLFKDGRAYSQARILREELSFKGRVRARGDVLLDQIFFMRRCGFDVFEVPDDADITKWQKKLSDFSLTYQPSNDAMKTIWELRHKSQDE